MSDDKMPADWRLGLCTDEIERLRAERDALQIACRDAHIAEAGAMAVLLGCEERVERQAAEITALRAAASKLVALAESGGVTGTTIADRVRVDALIGKLRDAMKGPQ